MIIALTGTPGCGKTTISKKLSKKYEIVDLNKMIKDKKLYDSYDRKRKTYIVDVKKIDKYIKNLKGNVIIDSHLSHLLNHIDLVIVLRCKPNILESRLKKKKWNDCNKIRENVEAEMISLISWEARQRYKKVFDVDTSKSLGINTIERIINGKGAKYKRQIDWL